MLVPAKLEFFPFSRVGRNDELQALARVDRTSGESVRPRFWKPPVAGVSRLCRDGPRGTGFEGPAFRGGRNSHSFATRYLSLAQKKEQNGSLRLREQPGGGPLAMMGGGRRCLVYQRV